MKTKIATACFIIGSLFVSVAATARDSDSDRTHPMTFVKDSVITTKIKAKLTEEKIYSMTHVHVDTDARGSVVLSGTVRNNEQEDRAIYIAKNTEGVTSVKNDLRIKKDD